MVDPCLCYKGTVIKEPLSHNTRGFNLICKGVVWLQVFIPAKQEPKLFVVFNQNQLIKQVELSVAFDWLQPLPL